MKFGKGLGVLLAVSGMVVASGEKQEPKPPRYFKEVGGSNYVMYRVGKEYLVDGKDWFKPGVMQPTVANFHLQKKEDVLAQLKAMHASEQRKISILIWNEHMTPEEMGNDGLYGHVIASNGGAFRPQHAKNLKGLVKLVCESGLFNELIFRHCVQGRADAREWEKWNEVVFRENMDFIIESRELIYEAMQGSGMKLVFDLGAELGGIETGCCREYTRRVWEEYTKRFGADDTFGFSMAGHPDRIRRWIEVCDEVGVRPSCYALDMYDHILEWMPRMMPEFGEAGIKDPKIIILETYWNDPKSLKDLQQIAADFDFEYEYLMQWPLLRGGPHPHFSDVFERADYDAHLK